ncbi:MAG: transglutaminaseTgpA domain-containing protein, partial [Pseudomonadales bacterium]
MTHLNLLFPAFALIAALATFGYVAELPIVTTVLGVFITIAWAINGRLEMGPYAQGLGTLFCVLLGIILTVLLVESDLYIRSVMYGCAIASLSIAAFRLAQSAPRYGHRGTAVLGIIPLIVAGALPADSLYTLGAATWAVLSIATLLLDDPSEPDVRMLSRRRIGFLSAGLIIASVLATGLALTVPPIQKWAIDRYVFGYLKPRTGFGHLFQLGSLTTIMESEDVAMRTYGANPGYLRGIVYGQYRAGAWSRLGSEEPRSVHVERFDPRMEHDWLRIERVADRHSDQYFTPLGAARIAVDDGRARVTAGGILHAAAQTRAERLAFQMTGSSQFPAAPPNETDLQVPQALHADLLQVLNDWVEPESVAREKLMTIQQQLKTHYTYSLNHARATTQDPVIDFLVENQIGHCEFFASALALLARTSGIPARVVGGYLVSEHNPFGDFYVVRERDAHAWVEAWFPETGWETWDATPPGALLEVTRREVSWIRSLIDYLAMLTSRRIDQLDQRDLYSLLGILAAVLLFLRLRALRRLRQVREIAAEADRPLPCYEQLADYLLALGLERAPGETIHQFAGRVREAPYG